MMDTEGRSKAFRFEANAFDLIRYWAAISVMIGHFMWMLSRYTQTDSIAVVAITRIVTFFPGVVVLFSMSGYLIAASYERSKNRKEFFVKRILRMYPELWICTIVNLIVVCLLVPYFLDKSIIAWLFTQIFGIANTPACLNDFATGSINGALWTIFTEVQLYFVLGFTYKKIKKLSTKKWIVLLTALAVCNISADFLSNMVGGVVSKGVERFFLTYALWFFIGVFCYVKRECLVFVLTKYVPMMLLLYVIFYLVPVNIPGYYANIATGSILPFLVMGGGYYLPEIRLPCDISYELFLYHWIVLNIMVHFGLIEKLPWIVGLIVFIMASFLSAWLSWRFVGKGKKKKGSIR